MTETFAPVRTKLVTKPFLVLAALAGVALILIIYRYIAGLGAVTTCTPESAWTALRVDATRAAAAT
jgi:Ni/Fe-hydrogenase subunit HybB-like protein